MAGPGIIEEMAGLVRDGLGREFQALTVERLVAGLFFTGVKLSDGSAGLCYTPIREIPQAVCCPSSAGRIMDPRRIKGTPARDMITSLGSSEPIKRAAALACLNALGSALWERTGAAGYKVHFGRDAMDFMDLPKDVPVAVVGALVPALRFLTDRGGKWWVIEQEPRTLRGDELEHFVPYQESHDVLKKAEAVIVTGATMVGNTLDQILATIRPGADVCVLGPTVGLIPEPFFDRGVNILGSVLVREPDPLMDIISSGGSGFHFFDDLAERTVISASDRFNSRTGGATNN